MPRQPVSGDKNAPVLADFRWSDGEKIVSAAVTQPVIDAVAEQIAIAVEVEVEPAVAWEND
jgi:hypothetical protein